MNLSDILAGRTTLDCDCTPVVKPRKRVKKVTNKQVVERFFQNYFQAFCAWQPNGVEHGTLLQVCIADIAHAYPTSALPEGDLYDYVINVKDADGLKGYRAEKSVAKPAFFCYKIYYAETHYVTKIKGVWNAIPLLKGEDYLSQKVSDAAFKKVAELNGYEPVNKKSEFAKADLHLAGIKKTLNGVTFRSFLVTNAQGEKRRLIIILDNGKMMDLAESQFENLTVLRVAENSRLATEMNWFRHAEDGDLEWWK